MTKVVPLVLFGMVVALSIFLENKGFERGDIATIIIVLGYVCFLIIPSEKSIKSGLRIPMLIPVAILASLKIADKTIIEISDFVIWPLFLILSLMIIGFFERRY